MYGNLTVDSVIRMIDQKIEEIWSEPPSEIDNLLESKGPYSNSFPVVINAYATTNGLAGFLWTLRKCAKAGDSINCLAGVTKRILESHKVIFEVCSLTSTTELLKNVSVILPRVKDLKE